MRIKTERDLWLFIVIVCLFALVATAIKELVLEPLLSPLVSGFVVAVTAASTVTYYIGRKFQQLTELYEERDSLLNFDRLTQVLTREGFLRRLASARNGTGAMLVVDIDYFKVFNDTHGHEAGDLVLSHTAGLLASGLRQGDLIARFGGEEFVIYLADVGLTEACEIAEDLRLVVAETSATYGDKSLVVTISIGVVPFEMTNDFDDVLRKADKALYRAKKSGRNTMKVHRDSIAA